MSKILVTGGTGYIGSHTVIELQQSGFDVVVIDNFSNSDAKTLERIESITGKRPEFFELDLQDREKVDYFFSRVSDVETVVHFAAAKAVGESVANPLKYYENNVGATVNLLQAMKKFGVNNFVFSSTAAVYGQPDKLPVDESSPVKNPDSPYGNTKKIIEEVARDLAQVKKNFQAIVLRYFNVVGAHSSGKIGELPLGEPANLVPYITQTVAGVREELKVFGNDYNTRDGFGVRDYIHVVDLARAHVVAVKRLQNKKNKNNYEIFNLGTGQGFSVKEVIDIFEKVNKVKVKYKIVDRRPGDVAEIYTSTELANKELGWQVKYGLEAMAKTAWEWEKNYRNLK